MTSPATWTEAPAVPDHDHAMVCQGCGASFLAILTDDEPDTLDEAWRAVEAVLPEYWYIRSLVRVKDRWEVVAADGRRIIAADGETVIRALQALRDKLVAG